MVDAAKEFFCRHQSKWRGALQFQITLAGSHPQLPYNYSVSDARLKTAINMKVTGMKIFKSYDATFREWLEEGFIEEV